MVMQMHTACSGITVHAPMDIYATIRTPPTSIRTRNARQGPPASPKRTQLVASVITQCGPCPMWEMVHDAITRQDARSARRAATSTASSLGKHALSGAPTTIPKSPSTAVHQPQTTAAGARRAGSLWESRSTAMRAIPQPRMSPVHRLRLMMPGMRPHTCSRPHPACRARMAAGASSCSALSHAARQ